MSIFRDSGDWDQVWLVVVRLSVAAALGAVLGFERQTEGKSAGIRTHMLVSLGAALFMLAPLLSGVPDLDMTRIVQGIATGVGFLGAGPILKATTEPHRVEGLTTAASIWVTAAAGVSIGAGLFWPAIVAVLLGWIILRPMQQVDHWVTSTVRQPSADDQTKPS